MTRTLRLIAALALVACAAAIPLLAAGSSGASKSAPAPGQEFAKAVTQLTGVAISPLLGASAVGAYQYFSADTPEEKASLAWFARPEFFLFGFLLVGAVAAKDSFGTAVPPGLKKPLDVLEVVEDKVSMLVAAGVVVPSISMIAGQQFFAAAPVDAASLAAAGLPGAVAASFGETFMGILALPFTVAAYLAVWLVSHSITVLILLSPFPLLDAILKAGRTLLLGTLAGLSQIAPETAAILSVFVVLVCALLVGWAFRLTVFGTIFSWDFLTRGHRRYKPTADNLPAFAANLRKAPKRSWGKLGRDTEGKLVFYWKPWLVLAARSTPVPQQGLLVGKGLFYSTVRVRTADDDRDVLLLLPPRCRGHEDAYAAAAGIEGAEDAGLRRGLKAAFAWLRELLSGKPSEAAA